MGVEPAECAVYDDSVEACRGAKAAGMHTVGSTISSFTSRGRR
ncbi:MAG: hypothetical protein ACLR39_05155 [Oscillospiraceae bacterium]